jgi:hypothetical protein
MVFLPEFVRVAAILVAGAAGALDLFLGALLGFGVFAIVVRVFALRTANFTDADSGSTPE